jgi:hypothetical protein
MYQKLVGLPDERYARSCTMRTTLVIVMVAVWAISAAAGDNPDCQMCVDFSGTATSWADVQSRIDPALYEPFSAYFCIYGVNAFQGICFTGYVTPGMSGAVAFTSLLPGQLFIGPWDEGITMASTECHTERFLYLARLDLIYLGEPGDVMILDHPQWPRWALDCDPAEVDYYCVWMHGGVGKDALEGDEECFPVVPVEDATWGSVKALYR